MYSLTTYLIYLIGGIALTGLTAVLLYRTGHRLLLETYHHNAVLARSVNRLLIASYCLVMAGFIVISMGYVGPAQAGQNMSWAIAQVATHFGGLLLFLGAALFVHIFALSRMGTRPRREARNGESILA